MKVIGNVIIGLLAMTGMGRLPDESRIALSGIAEAQEAEDTVVQDALAQLKAVPRWEGFLPEWDDKSKRGMSESRLAATRAIARLARFDSAPLLKALRKYMEDPGPLSTWESHHRILTALALTRFVFDLNAVDQRSLGVGGIFWESQEGDLYPWTVEPSGEYVLSGKPNSVYISVYPYPDPVQLFRRLMSAGAKRMAIFDKDAW